VLSLLQSAFRSGSVVVGSEVRVCGWVRSVRHSRSVAFVIVNDGSCLHSLQVVMNREDARLFTNGSSIQVTGSIAVTDTAAPSASLSLRHLELHPSSPPLLLGSSPASYPISKQQLTLEYLRDHTHLRLRTNTLSSLARIRATAFHAFHAQLAALSFIHVHTPIITPLDCEGGGETFSLSAPPSRSPSSSSSSSAPFFSRPAFLTVSGQLYAEMAAASLARVYAFGPTFRAETSVTPRHLSEFWMLEPEAAFCSLQEVMTLAEDTIRAVMRRLLAECADELSFLQERGEGAAAGLLERAQAVLDGGRWPRLSYTEAVRLLQQSGQQFEHAVQWGAELQSEHERWLAERHCRAPVFITHFPRSLKPFYMKTDDSSLQDGDGRVTALCFDLLVPGVGELVGGSQREDRYDQLKQRMEQAGLPMDQYAWYLDLRKSAQERETGRRHAESAAATVLSSVLPLCLSLCVLLLLQVRQRASQRLRPRLRALPALPHRRVQHQRPHRRPARAGLTDLLSATESRQQLALDDRQSDACYLHRVYPSVMLWPCAPSSRAW
jgi:asparaginyl-tRNA synthetase